MESSTTELIVRAKDFVAVCDALSATRTTKFAVPALPGTPLITPPAESVSPVGSVPDASVHEYGAVPPVAAKV